MCTVPGVIKSIVNRNSSIRDASKCSTSKTVAWCRQRGSVSSCNCRVNRTGWPSIEPSIERRSVGPTAGVWGSPPDAPIASAFEFDSTFDRNPAAESSSRDAVGLD